MWKCMVSMATHNAIQEWWFAYKITHILATTCPRLLNMVSNKKLDRGLSSIVTYVNYLIYLICITIYENNKVWFKNGGQRVYLQNQ